MKKQNYLKTNIYNINILSTKLKSLLLKNYF